MSALEVVDRKGFVRDSWQRPEGGGGTTCIVENGQVFERGGVNLSRVHGRQLPPSASAARPELAGRAYDAMGVSLVLHPRNPLLPHGPHERAVLFSREIRGGSAAAWTSRRTTASRTTRGTSMGLVGMP